MQGRRATEKEHKYIKKVLNAYEARPSKISKIILFIICIMIIFVIVVQMKYSPETNISPLVGCLVLFGGMAVIASGNAKEKNAINAGRYMLYEGLAYDFVPYELIETRNPTAKEPYDLSVSNGKIRFVYDEDPSKQILIELPYKSCPGSVIYSQFPALLIVLEDGSMFAIPDWEKINHDDNYIEMRNHSWVKYN